MSSAAEEPRRPEGPPPHDDELVPYELMEWTRPWMGAFLRALSGTPNVAFAARFARVSTTTVHDWRQKDEAFAAAWAEAWAASLDAVEREVHVRGMLGRDKTIVHTHVKRDSAGQVIEEKRVETTVHEFSDNLLLALLRAHRPEKWSERRDVRVGGHDGGPVQHEVVARQAALPRSADRLRALAEIAVELELAPPPVVEGNGRVVHEEDT